MSAAIHCSGPCARCGTSGNGVYYDFTYATSLMGGVGLYCVACFDADRPRTPAQWESYEKRRGFLAQVVDDLSMIERAPEGDEESYYARPSPRAIARHPPARPPPAFEPIPELATRPKVTARDQKAPLPQPAQVSDHGPHLTHGLPPGSIIETSSCSSTKHTDEGRAVLIRNGPCYNCKTVLSTRWWRKLRGEEEHPDGRVWCVTCTDSDYQMKKVDEKNPGRTRNPKDLKGGPCCICEKAKSSSWKDVKEMPLPKGKATREHARSEIWCHSCWKRKSEAAAPNQQLGQDREAKNASVPLGPPPRKRSKAQLALVASTALNAAGGSASKRPTTRKEPHTRGGPCHECRAIISPYWCQSLHDEQEHPDSRVWCKSCYSSDYHNKKRDGAHLDRKKMFKNNTGGPCCVCEKVRSTSWLDEQGPLATRGGRREAVGAVWCQGCWKRRADCEEKEERDRENKDENHEPDDGKQSGSSGGSQSLPAQEAPPMNKRLTAAKAPQTRRGPCHECRAVVSPYWCSYLHGEQKHPDGRVWCKSCHSSDYHSKKNDEKNPDRKKLVKNLSGGPCCDCGKIKSTSWKDMYGPLASRNERREAAGRVWCQGCWKRISEAEGQGEGESHEADVDEQSSNLVDSHLLPAQNAPPKSKRHETKIKTSTIPCFKCGKTSSRDFYFRLKDEPRNPDGRKWCNSCYSGDRQKKKKAERKALADQAAEALAALEEQMMDEDGDSEMNFDY